MSGAGSFSKKKEKGSNTRGDPYRIAYCLREENGAAHTHTYTLTRTYKKKREKKIIAGSREGLLATRPVIMYCSSFDVVSLPWRICDDRSNDGYGGYSLSLLLWRLLRLLLLLLLELRFRALPLAFTLLAPLFISPYSLALKRTVFHFAGFFAYLH